MRNLTQKNNKKQDLKTLYIGDDSVSIDKVAGPMWSTKSTPGGRSIW